MTTRRLPRGPAPPRGLIGLFGLFAMNSALSVEARQRRIDSYALPQHAVEPAARQCPLEAEQPSTRVHAASREHPPGSQLAPDRGEAQQIALRRLAAAAGATANRRLLTRQALGPPPRTASSRQA